MTQKIIWQHIRTRPVAAGRAYENTGAYEFINARAVVCVDPSAPSQSGIVDLDLASRDTDGLVRFATDVQLLRPIDPARGNRRLFVEIVNRGNKRCLQFFNDAPATNDPVSCAAMGNSFLLRRGYTIAWIGWQGDILPGNDRLQLDLPFATRAGAPITGPVRSEFIAGHYGCTTFPLSGWATARSHPAVSLDTRAATLQRRRYPGEPAETIAPGCWSFARIEGGSGLDNQGAESAVIASDCHIHMLGGFEPGWIYELVYEARDPLVLGLGHAAVREVTGFLRHARVDDKGVPNPLADSMRLGPTIIDKVYAWGRSQSGRYLRDFVHQGFNVDSANRKIFDGIMPHVSGGGLMWMNHRFANVIRPAGQEFEDHFNPADRFPFSYAESTDHMSGKTDAILKRPDSDPFVLHTQSATEYWQRHGSLVHTDTRGNDLAQPEKVRVYLWSSSQHFADPLLKTPASGICREPINNVRTSMLFRAMLDVMDAWATHGTAPPDSRIPRRADGTLVEMDAWRKQFPPIPGLMLPRGPSALPQISWGVRFEQGLVAEPPQVVAGERYSVGIPAVDADGNDIAGVRAPMVSAALATCTGWNIRARGHGFGAMHEFTGSTVVFPSSEAERRQTDDPRIAIEARFATADAYGEAIRSAASRLVGERLMLEEDIERSVAAASHWWQWARH